MNVRIHFNKDPCPRPRPLPYWPERTIAVLSTSDERVHAIPVTAPQRAGDRRILLRLRRSRGSLARLREHPYVALTMLAAGNRAFTARGRARVVREPTPDASQFATVAIDVDEIDDHRHSSLVVESGVALYWDDERTRLFLQEHRNALRAVAAADYAEENSLSVNQSASEARAVSAA